MPSLPKGMGAITSRSPVAKKLLVWVRRHPSPRVLILRRPLMITVVTNG